MGPALFLPKRQVPFFSFEHGGTRFWQNQHIGMSAVLCLDPSSSSAVLTNRQPRRHKLQTRESSLSRGSLTSIGKRGETLQKPTRSSFQGCRCHACHTKTRVDGGQICQIGILDCRVRSLQLVCTGHYCFHHCPVFPAGVDRNIAGRRGMRTRLGIIIERSRMPDQRRYNKTIESYTKDQLCIKKFSK